MINKTRITTVGTEISEVETRTDGRAHKIFNKGKLIFLTGENKMGEFGRWIDEDGLCEHERVQKYCEDCR